MKPDVRQSPAYQLWLASNAWQRQMRRVLEPWHLTHTQFAVLSTIDRFSEGSGCSQVEVARWLGIDENMTSQVVRSLEKRGLIERHNHPTDRRAHRVSLTPDGQQMTLAAREVVRACSERFFAPLGAESASLVALLRTVVDHSEA